MAWNSTTNNTTPTEADTVPHLKYYLQVQTNYTGVSHSSSADNITYEHGLLKGLIGLDSNFVSTIMVTQGEGGPSSSASLGTSGSQAGDFWFTQPTAGILSFYGVTDKVDASTDLATFNTKYPMISYVRYTGETGFGAGSGGGGGAAADPQQSLTEEPSWSSDSMTTSFIDGVIIASTEMDSNTDSRPAIATRNSSTSIKDYEISAIPNHYTNFTSNYGWDHGFLRIRAGGGTSASQTSYIDLTGYSQNADMTRNIVFGTAGTERMRINSSGRVGIGTTSPGTPLHVNTTASETVVSFDCTQRYCQVDWKNSGAQKGAIWTDSTDEKFAFYTPSGWDLDFYAGALLRWQINSDGTLLPNGNNTRNIGTASTRVSVLYTANAVNVSDQTLKTEIEDCDLGLDFINTLQPKSYKNLQDVGVALEEGHDDYNRKHYGLIAQDLKDGLLKDSVYGTKDGEYSLAYNDLIAPLIKAVQEQQEQIETLKQEVEELKG